MLGKVHWIIDDLLVRSSDSMDTDPESEGELWRDRNAKISLSGVARSPRPH